MDTDCKAYPSFHTCAPTKARAHCRGLNLECFEGRATELFNRAPEDRLQRGRAQWREWMNSSSFRSGEQAYNYLYHQLGFGTIG